MESCRLLHLSAMCPPLQKCTQQQLGMADYSSLGTGSELAATKSGTQNPPCDSTSVGFVLEQDMLSSPTSCSAAARPPRPPPAAAGQLLWANRRLKTLQSSCNPPITEQRQQNASTHLRYSCISVGPHKQDALGK